MKVSPFGVGQNKAQVVREIEWTGSQTRHLIGGRYADERGKIGPSGGPGGYTVKSADPYEARVMDQVNIGSREPWSSPARIVRGGTWQPRKNYLVPGACEKV